MKTMKKIYQYILLAVAMVATASCSNELDDTLQPVNNGNLQFVVSDFPAFGEDPQTRASSLGTPDKGKTAWAEGDVITVTFISDYYGEQTATLTYDGSAWTSSGTLSYLKTETSTVTAVYNPSATSGLGEYLTTTDCTIADNALNISFANAVRTYSRLRIVTLADLPLTVTTTGFTPAGAEEPGEHSYTLTADKKGNAYLYGTFAAGASVTVTSGDMTMANYTFKEDVYPNGTETSKSYALQAGLIIDGTFGGKAEVTKDEVDALMEVLKDYVDNGGSTVIITGSDMATYPYGELSEFGYSAILLNLTYYTENYEDYYGKVDLILPDATEIGDHAFFFCECLKSITLPKVKTIGDTPFDSASYVETLTFGSVITSAGARPFSSLGVQEGVDLVLNCGQMQTEGDLKPDIEKKEWGYNIAQEANYTWKSITLTHTGLCDECKAAEQ